MPAQSKAQQRFMGMVHATQKGELENPSKEVEKAADSMSDADAKDYASTKHKGLPNHVKKENMEKQLKEIIRQTYRESLRESVNEVKYPTDLKVGSVILGQGFTMLKGIEGGKYYKVVAIDDYSATLVPSDKSGNVKGSSKVRHKLDSIEGGIKTAKRDDENGIVVIKESVNEAISHEAMGIASITNTRKEAVQKFIDDNNLDAQTILKDVTKGKLPERVRFIQALVGTPGNSSFKWYVKNYASESVIKEGVYKSILSNNKGKLFFSLVDDETDKVTDVDAKAWLKSTIKDKSSDNSKELVLSALVRQINQFNKKVDFNMWVNANKPTWEEKVKYLFDKGLANNVNKTGIKVH
jgi:hypothetical protein